MVRLWQVCVFWFGMLLVPAVGYLMLELGAADPIMVTFLGLGVVLVYFGLKVALSSQRKKHVDFLNDYFDAVLHATTHEELRDKLEVLLRELEKTGTEGYLKETSAYDRYQNLRKCLELTLTAIDYKDSRRADSESLKKLKLDLPNLEIQLRSIGWGEGEASVAQRLYNVRYQYWFSFAAALRLWSGVALPMILITWCIEATMVIQEGQNPKEVYTLGYYSVACFISFVIARLFGWR
jgi:hypothetical protein